MQTPLQRACWGRLASAEVQEQDELAVERRCRFWVGVPVARTATGLLSVRKEFP